MKRSKIYLGITTALLAVAGVAVAKHYGVTSTAYYITHGQNWCLSGTSICTSSGTIQCTFNTGSHKVNLFTKGPAGPFIGTACTILLKYHIGGDTYSK